MAIKTFTTGEVLTASDTNTYLANSGLVYITGGTFSGTTNNVPTIFSATYDSYRVVLSSVSIGAAGYFVFRMLNGTTPLGTTVYYSAGVGNSSAGVNSPLNAGGASVGYIQNYNANANTNYGAIVLDIVNPFLTRITQVQTNATNVSGGAYFSYSGICAVDTSTSYDGIQFLQHLGATTVSATYRIYGYRQA